MENDHYPHRIHLSDDHEPSISSEALTYANSLAFPPITIIGTPAFTSHSTPDIIFIFYVRSSMLI
jgi:hypothetical protein